MRELRERGRVQWIVKPPDSVLGERARDLGFPVVERPFRFELDPVAIGRLREVIRRFDPDVIHCHDSHALATGSFASRFVRPRPKVVGHRRVSRPLRRNPVSRWKWSRGADRVIAIGSAVRERLIADGVPAERVRVVHDGIPLDPPPRPPVPLAERIGAGPDASIVMTMAALNDDKDHATLISSGERLARRRVGVRWVVFGSGPSLDRTRAEVRRRGLAGRIHYLGFDPDARAHLADVDVFVLPTKSEGLGTSVLEAMAVGVPVVASAVGGIPELVSHEATGLLVPPRDPGAVESAVTRLLEDRALARRLGEAGRERARDFDVARTTVETEAVYREVVG